MIKAGILGGSGYMGGELIRVLVDHPDAEVCWITSRGDKPVEHYHRNLYGMGLRFTKPDRITPCDVVFAALPTGEIQKLAPSLLASGTKIIDLGADFRLHSRSDWEAKYRRQHACWDVAMEAVYGVTELHREETRRARVVANPGCYASATILALAPLVNAGAIELDRIVVDGLSGTTGVGSEPDVPSHHPEIANNIVPYNVVDHRHTYEIEQELGGIAGSSVTVHFTTSYVPITRGILAICHCFPTRGVSRKELLDMHRAFYDGHPFVKVFDMPRDHGATWQHTPYPWVAAVSGTNYCHVGLDVDEKRGRIVVFSVLDSVGKGGAQVGVQNMNLMFGLPEETGLTRAGMHPY
jgi:N-acetyl-gamma-glutamyl-phosphate reductase common form